VIKLGVRHPTEKLNHAGNGAVGLFCKRALISEAAYHCVAVCCSVTQYFSVFFSVLQCGRALLQKSTDILGSLSLCCSMLQCVAVCGSVL